MRIPKKKPAFILFLYQAIMPSVGDKEMNVKDAAVKRIIQLCRQTGMSYNELANVCGVTPSTIYSLLDPSRRKIALNTIKIICDGLEISLTEFFSAPIFEELEQEIQ